MNILYAMNSLNIGGAEKITVETILGMKNRGHNVYVSAPHGYYENLLINRGVKVYYLNFDAQKKTIWSFFILLFGVLRIIKRDKIDIIHTMHRWPNFICYFAAYACRKCLIWTDHNILSGKKLLTFYKDFVISVSNANRDYLIRYFKVPKEKIEVIHNGIKPITPSSYDDIQKFRSSLNLDENDILICNIGRAVKQKGQIYLVKAMKEITKNNNNIHCLIAGGGPLFSDLKNEIINMGLEKNVHLVGEIEDPTIAISASSLIVLPSLWEGFPLVILESYFLGKPVIASNVGGVQDIVSNGENGYLVAPTNVNELSNTILLALSDSGNLKKMGENARELVSKEFSISKMLDRIEHVYQKTLYDKRREGQNDNIREN